VATQGLILCDTNILIEFYKNNQQIVRELRAIGQSQIAISIITAAELFYGAYNKQELHQLQQNIALIHCLPLNEPIGELHLRLVADYSLSHNLTLPDALIAATAVHFQIPLYTLNHKDFHYLPELKLYQPTT